MTHNNPGNMPVQIPEFVGQRRGSYEQADRNIRITPSGRYQVRAADQTGKHHYGGTYDTVAQARIGRKMLLRKIKALSDQSKDN